MNGGWKAPFPCRIEALEEIALFLKTKSKKRETRKLSRRIERSMEGVDGAGQSSNPHPSQRSADEQRGDADKNGRTRQADPQQPVAI